MGKPPLGPIGNCLDGNNAPDGPRLNTAKHNVLIGNALVIRAVKWT
jgi:hypothetical protein